MENKLQRFSSFSLLFKPSYSNRPFSLILQPFILWLEQKNLFFFLLFHLESYFSDSLHYGS